MGKVELLAPVGDRDALIAAVQNGADAVYLGGRLFGARANASNFDGDGLAWAVDYCHLHGVKLYMTINTLVRDDEMRAVYDMAAEAVAAGIDAAIVQDLGVAQMLKESFPGLHLHASTQMSIHSASGAQFVKEMGMTRVVPARECTLEEISAIAGTGLEVEVFVHGALCVSYSGQCLLSSMIGGRSGNRGRCAQPCRLPYTLSGEKRYFLSPADLCMRSDLRQLIDAGATSLKMEGRLKRPEYVAVVTAAYRRALDRALAGKPAEERDREELLSIFNRGGFTRGYAVGGNDASVMATARPNHWGVRVGKVLTVRNGRAKVQLQRELHNGDGLEARGVYGDRGVVVQGIQGDLLRVPEGVRPGDELFRTTDAQQLERARESYAKEHRRTRADAHFEAHIGLPCRLTLGGAEALGDVVQPARGKPLEESAVRAQIAKLGDTVLELGNLTCAIDENAFLSVSALNALRREAAQQCERMLLEKRSPDRTVRPYEAPSFASYAAQGPLLILQSDDVRELLAAQGEADELYYAPSDLTAPALQKALDQLPQKVRVVLPNILSDKELSEAMRVIGSRSIVCGNPAQLQSGCVTDVGLNVFNAGTAKKLLALGAIRVTASPELTFAQAQALAHRAPVELVIHGNVPLMTLRHCPIRTARGLDGSTHADCSLCGHKGDLLIDRKGEALPLKPYRAVSGCRVQIFGPHTYSALTLGSRLAQSGFAALRVIGTRQDLALARRALNGEDVQKELGNITFGHLFKGVE